MKNPYNFAQIEMLNNSYKSNKIYKIIFSLLIIGIVIVLCKFKFQVYEKITLVKDNSNYILLTSVEEVPFIENNNRIRINNKDYNYKISSITKDYTSINGNVFQTITVNINKLNTNAHYVTGYILRSNQTLIEMLIEFISGG